MVGILYSTGFGIVDANFWTVFTLYQVIKKKVNRFSHLEIIVVYFINLLIVLCDFKGIYYGPMANRLCVSCPAVNLASELHCSEAKLNPLAKCSEA